MSLKKKKLLKTILTANAGCGCGCGKPKLSEVYEPIPIPKSKTSKIPFSFSCSTSYENILVNSMANEERKEDYTSTTISNYNMDNTCYTTTSTVNSASEAEPRPSKFANSFVVVKDSNDPCQDFKDSMLEMVLEKQICSRDELEELLNSFLELNSPTNHHLIVRAFTEMWKEVISVGKLVETMCSKRRE